MADDDKKPKREVNDTRFAVPATGDKSNPAMVQAIFPQLATSAIQHDGKSKSYYLAQGKAIIITSSDRDKPYEKRNELLAARIVAPGAKDVDINMGGVKVDKVKPGSSLLMLRVKAGTTLNVGELDGARIVKPDGSDPAALNFVADKDTNVLVVVPKTISKMGASEAAAGASDVKLIAESIVEYNAASKVDNVPAAGKLAALAKLQEKYEAIKEMCDDVQAQLARDEKKEKGVTVNFNEADTKAVKLAIANMPKTSPALKIIDAGMPKLAVLMAKKDPKFAEMKDKQEVAEILDAAFATVKEEIEFDKTRPKDKRQFPDLKIKEFERKLEIFEKAKKKEFQTTGVSPGNGEELVTSAEMDESLSNVNLSDVNLEWMKQGQKSEPSEQAAKATSEKTKGALAKPERSNRF